MVAHEIGHNFGSLHTHDGYNPKVDECGVEDANGKKTCPAELPLEHSSTIMSYCHNCIGGVSNVAYTFGGTFEGGNRHDINSWKNSELVGSISYEPRRVPLKMWEHVSSRGTCVSPTDGPYTLNALSCKDCWTPKG